ncbi:MULTISPECIES: DUF7144 family membrane protein [unclassified Nocardioides]|uniref:DUF7144 family membrane protein n=1 Tax=unclassified Nocardioides TaxID=2615069 RepID=UPI00360C14B1
MSTEQKYDDYSARGMVLDFGATLAGILLIITSGMNILQGLSAISNDELYAAGSEYLYKLDMTVWGTIHLVLGIIGVACGIGIVARVGWALVGGMLYAGVAILTNFAFIPHYPLWSIVIIAFNGFVIWVLSSQVRSLDY